MKKLQNLRQFIIDNSKINTNVSNDLIDAVIREVQADVDTYKTAADVTFTPVTGTAVAIGSTVALASATDDAQIYYTVDGSAPDNTDTLYTGPIVITDDITIKAIAYHNYQNASDSTTAAYTLLAAATPIADPVAGGVPGNSTVAISCATPNSTVYYTTNGDEPTDASTKYTEPILITDAVTIKAIAYVADRDPSAVLTAAYTIAGAATPVATPEAGAITDNSTITLTCATAGSTIYYTVNGDEPTDASTEYIAPIDFTDAVTIKAIAYAPNYEPSEVLTAVYTISD